MINCQIHNETRIPLMNTWIKIQFKNVHAKPKDLGEACNLNLGSKTRNRRLRLKLPKDLFLTDTEIFLSEN